MAPRRDERLPEAGVRDAPGSGTYGGKQRWLGKGLGDSFSEVTNMAEMLSLEAAAQVMRQAMRETVKRHALWYLIQGGLMGLGGFLALVYPLFSSVGRLLFSSGGC